MVLKSTDLFTDDEAEKNSIIDECSKYNNTFHNHTDASLGDGVTSPQQLVQRAKEIGASAIAITDHGVCYNWTDFYNAARAEGIKPVRGVEAYIKNSDGRYNHLILLSKNPEGERELDAFVTETEKHRESMRTKTIPVATEDMLDMVSNGNVICTSACIQGPVADPFMKNVIADREIEKISRQIEKARKEMPEGYEEALKKEKKTNDDINRVMSALKQARSLSKMPSYRATEKRIEAMTDEGRRARETAILENEKKQRQQQAAKAKENIPLLEQKRDELKESLKTPDPDSGLSIKDIINQGNKKQKRLDELNQKIKDIENSRMSDEQGIREAAAIAERYRARFGDDFYIEVQNHGIPAEKYIYPKLADIASQLGIKLVAANDSHIPSQDYVKVRNMIQNIRWMNDREYKKPSVGDDQLYIKSGAELARALLEILPPEQVLEAMKDTEEIDHKIEDYDLIKHKAYPGVERPDQALAPDEIRGFTDWLHQAEEARAELLDKYPGLEKVHELDNPEEMMKGMAPEEQKAFKAIIDNDSYIKTEDGYELRNINEKPVDTQILRYMTIKGIKDRFPDGFPDREKYLKRMNYELDIIDKMGFSSYFLVINDVVKACKEEGKKRGELWIGPARGSGAGSLVNYLIQNTELDPIEHGLIFERFLNPERVSMPDIDTDFSEDARKFAIKHVKEKYGNEAVAGIMTKTRMQMKGAIENASKLNGINDSHNRRTYLAITDKAKKELDSLKIDNIEDAINYYRKNNGDPELIKILEDAEPLEGLMTTTGQHAAGVIIVSEGHKVCDYVPEMRVIDNNGNEGFAIQADMIQAEAQYGFIKFDFLGLSNLDVISKTMHLVKQDYGVDIDPYSLPVRGDVIKDIFQTGDTNFVFQFESEGMKDMLAKLRPETFDDLVLAVSVYRPGPMDFIPDIIKSKNTGAPSEIIKKIPMLKDVLAETYGYPVYQEQVMRIMTDCAGFTMGEADNVRRAMSKKHEDELAAAKPKFIEGSVKNGISEEDAGWLFDQLMPFAKYGFNKSHAASYSLVSYITAYLKHDYFKEYVCGAMTKQGDKIPQLIEDCRKRDIKIMTPDINMSEVDFSPVGDDAIIYGLSAIKGVKGAADRIVEERKKNGTFRSISDFIERVNPDTGVLEALAATGAFESVCRDRRQAKDLAERCKSDYADWQKKKISYEKAKEKYEKQLAEDPADTKKTVRLKAAMDKAYSDQEIYHDELVNETDPDRRLKARTGANLKAEFEYLGGWISGSPLDEYSTKGYDTALSEPGERKIAGVITDYKLLHRKSDGADMCKFRLVDRNSNAINCIVFTKEYQDIRDYIKNGAVVCIEGEVRTEEKEDGDEVRITRELRGKKAVPLSEKQEVMMISLKTETDRLEKFDPMLNGGYKTQENGIPFKVFVEQTQDHYNYAEGCVSKDIAERIRDIGGQAEIIKTDPDPAGYIGKDEEELLEAGTGYESEEPEMQDQAETCDTEEIR